MPQSEFVFTQIATWCDGAASEAQSFTMVNRRRYKRPYFAVTKERKF